MTHDALRGATGLAGRNRAILAILAVILLLPLSLVGCSDDSRRDDEESAEAAPDPTVITDASGRSWRRIEADGLHDPANDMVEYLQQPAEALSVLPEDGPEGNKVDWAAALAEGAIKPRTNVRPETKIRVLDLDIVFEDTAGQPNVVFPHRQHTEWLDCSNCHPKIFVARKGANDFGMFDVLQGRYCGRCHGAVAFPLTRCKRCHSRDRQDGEGG